MVSRRVLFGLVSGLALAAASPASAQQKIQIEFWHGLTQPNGGLLEQIAADFNASQNRYQVNATFKGSYPETMAAAIAAFRAGNAPHIVQMFEVGTATMMAAGAAIKPVYALMQEAGVAFDPNAYVGAIRGYYSTADGRMLSMPFNSSTPIMFYNKDAFQKAGLDPEKAPRTWRELREAANKIKATGASACPFTTAWPTWTQYENFSAIHNVPLATKANGLGGLDTELRFNSPAHVKHIQMLIDMQKDGTFKYGGRDSAGESAFPTGECAIIHTSSGFRGRVQREAQFKWGVAMLPYHDDLPGAPKNSIIGGASLWVMTSPRRTPAEYRGVAEFFGWISRPEVVAKWHTDTGFVAITKAGFDRVAATDFYRQNPGADVPFQQLNLTPTTENSMGLRLGNMPEIRVIMQEELEKAFQGQQTAQQALDVAVQRGNAVLRNFERANRTN